MRAACAYCLVALVDRFLPINQGLARAIDATFREGSVVDPRFPSGGKYLHADGTHRRGSRPDERSRRLFPTSASPAARAARRWCSADAMRRSDRAFVHYEIFSGGTGARSGKDGVSATAFHLSNCKTAPIEIIESEFPARVERFEMIADSGGAGEWRGGLGFARDYRILADDVRFSMRTDKHTIEPFGSDRRLARRQGRLHRQSRQQRRQYGCHPASAITACARTTSSASSAPAAADLVTARARPVEYVLEDVRQGLCFSRAGAVRLRGGGQARRRRTQGRRWPKLKFYEEKSKKYVGNRLRASAIPVAKYFYS